MFVVWFALSWCAAGLAAPDSFGCAAWQRKLLIRENYYGINDNPNHNRFLKLFLRIGANNPSDALTQKYLCITQEYFFQRKKSIEIENWR